MAGEIYLHIDGITGTSRSASRREWIACQALAWDRPASPGMTLSGKSGIGRHQHGNIVIARLNDWASPLLGHACAAGRRLPNARIELTRAGAKGASACFVEIELFDILLAKGAGMAPGQAEGQHDSRIEQLQLDYSRVQWRYCTDRITSGSTHDPA